jgi:glucose-1-phosphate thymidylyltransferase
LKDKKNEEVIGLIPAAGNAARMDLLPCSKELLPLGIEAENRSEAKFKIVISYLLESLHVADIKKVYIVLRRGKWDIPAYLGDGSGFNMHLCYLMQGLPYGVPYTLDQALPFIKESIAALGFPDIIYKADDLFTKLLERLKEGDAEVALGLFPADRPKNADGVEFDSDNIIRRVVPKPHKGKHRIVCAAAVWKPVFTQLMHDYLANLDFPSIEQSELQIGHIVQLAIKKGQRVVGVHVSKSPPTDVGTPENFMAVVREFNKTGL